MKLKPNDYTIYYVRSKMVVYFGARMLQFIYHLNDSSKNEYDQFYSLKASENEPFLEMIKKVLRFRLLFQIPINEKKVNFSRLCNVCNGINCIYSFVATSNPRIMIRL